MNKEELAQKVSDESMFSCAPVGNVVQAETVHLKMSRPLMHHESPIAVDDIVTNPAFQSAVCEASE
jgi:hypothetical protein